MATSLLLRSLSRRVIHSTTSAISTYRCLTDNVKKQPSATSPLGKNLMSNASRSFSSKPAGDVALPKLEVKVPINQLNAILDRSECVPMECNIVEAPGGDAWVEVQDVEGVLRYSLSQFGPFAFTKIKKVKELVYGATLSKAVMVVPSYFNDNQRDAAKDAATIAGFELLQIVTDESSPEECSYKIIKGMDCRHFIILNLSRGSFDIDIEEIIPLDDSSRMLETFVREIKKIYGMDIRNYPSVFQGLEEDIEKSRVYVLTNPDKTTIVKLEATVDDQYISLILEVSKRRIAGI